MFARTARLMNPADRLILSGNLSPSPYSTAAAEIVPQYDNPEARAWYDGALLALGLPLEHTTRALVSDPIEPSGEIWRMKYLATPAKPVPLVVYGEGIELPAHQLMRVFHSTRYTPERLSSLCAESGLTTVAAFIDDDRVEGVYLLRRKL